MIIYDDVLLQFANILEKQELQASLLSVPASMKDVKRNSTIVQVWQLKFIIINHEVCIIAVKVDKF